MLRLSKEQRFLLNLLRNDGQSKSVAKNILKEKLDWNWILEFAEQNRVWPLLYNELRKFDDESIPEYVMKRLKDIAFHTASKNILMEHDIKGLSTVLKEKKLGVIMLKGLVMQEKIYSNKIARPMADIDLLVKKEDLLRVDGVLLENGFVFDARRISKEMCLKKGEHDFPYLKENTKTMVEVHGILWTNTIHSE